ncbi:MAG: 2-C-methyl-D-erythritol 4-phosphate cytidylyltransferase [Lachnospiraceae bacterium]|nr:2-C-methyl-D-erythritol 4-phosphate cytidylyltransferase [Lachnospiraceae bacterium]MDY5742488.1 2-C-methyl-D-erythritol 4-phosphate cytidylyltransferase [Lachnospiraceae bacterium]
MIFAGVLAGGKGTRMGIQDMPKQFLMLGSKPIIVHTIEKFLFVPQIDQVIVAVHPDWTAHFEDLVNRYLADHAGRLQVVDGGGERSDSIMNVITYLKERYDISEQDFLITHDAVRPFLSYRTIVDNIQAMERYAMVDTVVMANDTIVESEDGQQITTIPNRKHMFLGQTPQTFGILNYERLYQDLTAEEKMLLTDACKVFVLRGKSVGLVRGEYSNIKITTVTDLKIAEAMLGEISSDK